ncbi:hypothetical protein AX16_000341 [Volvariella volvacea WC 439]|nr:hypothetical protein AX16_000341 [Volvariella volvacea WC 439]
MATLRKEGDKILVKNPTPKEQSILLARKAGSETVIGSSLYISEQDTSFQNKLLVKDLRSFLTGSASLTLQACHLISAVHGSSPEELKRKKDVEDLLSDLAIIGPGLRFDLDSINNGILLCACERVKFELYGAFVFLPTKHCLHEIQRALYSINRNWDHLVSKEGRLVPRPMSALAEDLKWQVIALHPGYLCPEGLPVMILKDAILKRVTNPVWEAWIVSEDDFTLRSSHGSPYTFLHSNPSLPPCIFTYSNTGIPTSSVFPTNRNRNENVSPIAAIINADAKFRYAFSHNYPCSSNTSVRELASLCTEILIEFFYQPHVSSTMARQQDDVSDLGTKNGFLQPLSQEFDQEQDCDVLSYSTLFQKARDPALEMHERAQFAKLLITGNHREIPLFLRDYSSIERCFRIQRTQITLLWPTY